MQTQQPSLTPEISVCTINSFGQKAQEIIETIPKKIKQAMQSGKRRVTVMTFSVSKNFSFSKDDFDSLPGIQVFDYCHLQFREKAELIYKMPNKGGRGRYNIVVAV